MISDKLFLYKYLIIPEYILPNDILHIIEYFEKNNIAKIKEVKYYEDNKIMYENLNTCECGYYGYATIEIDEWYENNTSIKFYEDIINSKCQIVFDEPDYWDVYFDCSMNNNYEESIYDDDSNSDSNYDDEENKHELQDYPEDKTSSEDDFVEIKLDDHHNVSKFNKNEDEENEENEEYEDENQEDENEEYEDEDEDEDEEYKDEDENQEHENEEDEESVKEKNQENDENTKKNQEDKNKKIIKNNNYEYESEYKYHKKYDGPITRLRSKLISKSTVISEDSKLLNEVIIKKKKKYFNGNKVNQSKSVWSHRLRSNKDLKL